MLNSNVIHMDALYDLNQFDILKGLQTKTLQKYLPYFYFRSYKKHQRLFTQGDPRDKIYFLMDGYVMYERSSEDGSMLYLDFIKKNQMFPYGGLFQDKAYQDTAIAVTDVYLYFMETHVLENLIKTHPKLLFHVISKLSDILILHQKRVQKILVPNAQDRVLHTLQFLMEDLGVKADGEIVIPCPLTAANIAKISGTTRETVSLFMNQLKREQVISVDCKKIRFHQPEYFH
ncbi:Crp/Fnr family transcriptional regulator [Neobacillus niacini]|uniref:Crp/Fnr family transcriptional regulator n=1 Tax=Neobacillus niacini TaxID=86668 RepID=UPI0021CAED7D|nr:Crp/Fnr family transcriptional regulator [Neobacillus niacini]MCM3765801.1 Crp/Fnr family transcriptional regulator [Neobacillus niacini]